MTDAVPLLPIPPDLGPGKNWRSSRIQECGEPLVALGPLAAEGYSGIWTSAVYAGEHNSPYAGGLPGARLTVLVRRSVADALLRAERLLQQHCPGLHVLVYDAYRPVQVQAALYDYYLSRLRACEPDLSEEELLARTEVFVLPASEDPACPSTHLTGGAVDWAVYELPAEVERQVSLLVADIARASAEGRDDRAFDLECVRSALLAGSAVQLDTGVPYDWGGPETRADYYEAGPFDLAEQRWTEVLRNRRLMYTVATSVGFAQDPDEWWHVDLGTQYAGESPARYGIALVPDWVEEHERRRRQLNAAVSEEPLCSLRPAARLAPPGD